MSTFWESMIFRRSGCRIRSVLSPQNCLTKQASILGAAELPKVLPAQKVPKNSVRVLVPLLEFNQRFRNGSLPVTTGIALVLKRQDSAPRLEEASHQQVIVWRILFFLSSSFAGDPQSVRVSLQRQVPLAFARRLAHAPFVRD